METTKPTVERFNGPSRITRIEMEGARYFRQFGSNCWTDSEGAIVERELANQLHEIEDEDARHIEDCMGTSPFQEMLSRSDWSDATR